MAEQRPTVTVITAAYNAAAWIEATLDSVQTQTYRDFEHIIVDDGSVDETPAILARYGGTIRYIRVANGGAAAARNVGIHAALGTFVAFLDHDDQWEPEKLNRQMALHAADPSLAWSYTDAAFFDPETGETLHLASDKAAPHTGDVLEKLLFLNFVPFSSSLVRRDLFDRFGLLDERPERRHIDDWDFWLRIAADHPVGYVAAPLLRYRWHAVQATQRMPLDAALRHRLALVDAAVVWHPDRLAPLRRRAHAAAHVSIGRLYLSRGEPRAARGQFAQALRRHITNRTAWIFLIAALVPPVVRRALRLFTPRT